MAKGNPRYAPGGDLAPEDITEKKNGTFHKGMDHNALVSAIQRKKKKKKGTKTLPAFLMHK